MHLQIHLPLNISNICLTYHYLTHCQPNIIQSKTFVYCSTLNWLHLKSHGLSWLILYFSSLSPVLANSLSTLPSFLPVIFHLNSYSIHKFFSRFFTEARIDYRKSLMSCMQASYQNMILFTLHSSVLILPCEVDCSDFSDLGILSLDRVPWTNKTHEIQIESKS